jgi:hypothetical protein
MPEPHIEDEILDRYASGTLPVDSLPPVEEHLLSCRFCQSRLVASDEFVVLFRAAAIQPDARPRLGWRPAWSPRAATWAAAAVMVAALLLVISVQLRTPSVAPATVWMHSLRGPEAAARIVAGKPAVLIFDITPNSGPDEYDGQIVNLVGDEIFTAHATPKDGHLAVLVRKIPKGSYWVRIYRKSSREPIAEYGLRAE